MQFGSTSLILTKAVSTAEISILRTIAHTNGTWLNYTIYMHIFEAQTDVYDYCSKCFRSGLSQIKIGRLIT